MKMRWLLVVVLLSTTTLLSCCQPNSVQYRTSLDDDNDEIRSRYEANYAYTNTEKAIPRHGRRERNLDDSDDPFYERIVSYRSNRAIDASRYILLKRADCLFDQGFFVVNRSRHY